MKCKFAFWAVLALCIITSCEEQPIPNAYVGFWTASLEPGEFITVTADGKEAVRPITRAYPSGPDACNSDGVAFFLLPIKEETYSISARSTNGQTWGWEFKMSPTASCNLVQLNR